jgi:hypothetical protein
MKCPICQSNCLPVRGETIGRLPGRPDLDLKTIIGYECPIQTDLPARAKTPHYTVRGRNEIVTLFPYRVSNWYVDFDMNDLNPDRSQGSSSIYHYTQQVGHFTEVTITPLIKWDTEDKMRNKLAIYILFS